MQDSLLNDKEVLYLPNGDRIFLNEQQLDVISHITQFLKSTSKFFVLSGHAGTGKTTVIKKVLDDYRGNSAVSAPTNKAVQVISAATMSEGVTIHALLGLQPDVSLEDFNPNEPKFNQIKPASIRDFSLIVIDESSMINSDLFDLIQNESEDLNRIKIVFMGDKAQIPPISESQSVVFDLDTIYSRELTSLVRQNQQNPLVAMYHELRENIDNSNYQFQPATNVNDVGEGIIVAKSKDEFRAKLIEVFTSKEYKDNLNYAKLIAWRNITVKQSNKIIRDIIFGKEAKIVEKGDILTGYRTVKGTKLIPYYINNCVDYKVASVSKIQKNKYGIKGYTVKILEKSRMFNGFDEKKIFIIDHADDNNLHEYAEKHDSLVDIAKADNKKWTSYYNFRRDNLLMVNVDAYRDGVPRHKSKQISKELDYGYAVTCHKVQGSTFDHVFVLIKDICLNSNYKERNQMLYVSLTRPKKTAVVL